MTKQGMMLTTFCYALGGCATEPVERRTSVVTPPPTPMVTLPEATSFPELEAAVGRAGSGLMRTLGFDEYEVSVVLPQSSKWRYVRDPRLRVVVRRESPIGVAVRGRRSPDRCLYLEPTVTQDRLGARDWGPLRLASDSYKARRLDCDLLASSLASR